MFANKKKMGLVVLGIAVLAILGVLARDYSLENQPDASPLNPLTKRYNCDDDRFLLLHLYTENGNDYVEAAFNDLQQASLQKATSGGRYTDAEGLLELYEVNGAWEVHQRERLVYKNCRLVSEK